LNWAAAVVFVLAAGSGLSHAAAPFKPCATNPGSVASAEPCAGPPGTLITIRTSRRLPRPARTVWFYEISSRASIRGTICYTCAAVVVSLTGGGNQNKGGTAVGSSYRFRAPHQLCINGSNQSWALYLTATPQATYDYGNIGAFTIHSCPAVQSGHSATSPGPASP
jgi:hypothetical protein